MSNTDANKILAKFGLLCPILAILYLVFVVISIIGTLSLYLLRLVLNISFVLQIGILALIIVGARIVGKAGSTLNNENLLTFRTYIVIGSVLITLSVHWLGILYPIGFNIIEDRATSGGAGTPGAIAVYITWGIIILIGLIMLIGGGVFNIIAWGRLKNFFDAKMVKFSGNIGESAKKGAFVCQLGAIFFLTFYLSIVGLLLNVIGYLLLLKLKDAEESI
ncbi:MAG: hypothetical protein EU540_03735 [Promethearchaeota archaeon]|nr:MAG: hypothetical protein EU540_03735 [Candidatus Lokiarchaeota archaeon]